MEKNDYKTKLLGEIVTNDFRAAEIFTRRGLDFCCGGSKTLDLACQEKSIAVSVVIDELESLNNTPALMHQNFKDWPLDFLADYIVNTHHKYVWKTLPELKFYTTKIANVHGSSHPEIIEVSLLFNQINTELQQHLKMEEEVLFPAIKKIVKNGSEKTRKLIRSEIERMHHEHDFAGGAMDTIQVITNGYQLPPDGCNTYMVTLNLLHQFENDLHIHVHLENNILFPKSLNL